MVNDKNENSLESSPTPSGAMLFQPDAEWWQNAHLDYGYDRWEIYATGYKNAADLLAERVLENRHGLDFLVYPLLFLYRHYLELRLKQLIISGQALLDHTPDLEHVHSLDVLWGTCRKIIQEVWPEGASDDLKVVGDCIKEICRKDPQSMSFRYPVKKDGSPTLPKMGIVGIGNLREVIDRVSSSLEGASMGISVYLQDKRSIEVNCYG